MIKTKYILLFDSDIDMIRPCLEEMLYILPSYSYGIGQVISVDKNGTSCEESIPYLHPHFCIIHRETYFLFPPFVHHGAPLIKTMTDIYFNGGMHKPINFNVLGSVIHKGRGTRDLNPVEFLNNWE